MIYSRCCRECNIPVVETSFTSNILDSRYKSSCCFRCLFCSFITHTYACFLKTQAAVVLLQQRSAETTIFLLVSLKAQCVTFTVRMSKLKLYKHTQNIPLRNWKSDLFHIPTIYLFCLRVGNKIIYKIYKRIM